MVSPAVLFPAGLAAVSGRQGSNLRSPAPKAGALPLGHIPAASSARLKTFRCTDRPHVEVVNRRSLEPPARVERATSALRERRSGHLSYGGMPPTVRADLTLRGCAPIPAGHA